jgi:hypothetical protein
MPVYTFIADYRGGTYICQPEASDLRSAISRWKEHVVEGHYVPDLNRTRFAETVDFYLDELPPMAIDEVRNVWLFKFAQGRYIWEVHVVQTDAKPMREPQNENHYAKRTL